MSEPSTKFTDDQIFNLVMDESNVRLRNQRDTTGPVQRVNKYTDQQILNLVFNETNQTLKF